MVFLWLTRIQEKYTGPSQEKLLIKVLDYQASVLSYYLGLDWVRLYKELKVIHLSY